MPANAATQTPKNLTRYAWLAIAAAIVTITIKFFAYVITDSVGLLSDAAESVVNLVAAVIALFVLHIAAKPADKNHNFGHSKAEYFSAWVEGLMIFLAAAFIIYTAIRRLFEPTPIENVGLGLLISLVASAVNGGVAIVLLRAGRRHRSHALLADGKHLMTDVWTSAGVVVGVVLVWLTDWLWLDPVVAIIVGINILVAGYHLISESTEGLMDISWSKEENARLAAVVRPFLSDEVQIHALRSRMSGAHRYAEMHVLVPGKWTVWRGHDVVEEIETAVQAEFEDCEVTCHLEPIEDPRAYGDFPAEIAVAEPRPTDPRADRRVTNEPPPRGDVPPAVR